MNTLIWNVRARRRRRAEAYVLHTLILLPGLIAALLAARLAGFAVGHPYAVGAAAASLIALANALAEFSAGRSRLLDPLRIGDVLFDHERPTAAKLARLGASRTLRLYVGGAVLALLVLMLAMR